MSMSSELIGTKLGRYSIVDHLATGGMAEIFLARQEAMAKFKKELVLKVLQERWEAYPEVVEMFLEEARISALMSHPNIVEIFDVATHNDRHYIAMEHIAGRTLAELAKRAIQVTKSISIEVGAYIAAEMASALAYMYDGSNGVGEPLRVVHRDISPSNILISTTGQVKVIDFGIARQGNIAQDSRARPGKFTYMSPEQVQGLAIDGRSDIFCLGTILYEITLGRRLWRGPREVSMKRIVEERPKPPTFVRRDYPADLELIVLRALEKRPEDRYQSATELHRDLQGFMARSNAHLRSHFHMADYVAKIFSAEADALISDVARKRAQEFADNADVSDGSRDELDFDSGQTEGPGAALARALRASALGVWAEPSSDRKEPEPDDPRPASMPMSASDAEAAASQVPVTGDASRSPSGAANAAGAPAAAAEMVAERARQGRSQAGPGSSGAKRQSGAPGEVGEDDGPPRRWLPVAIAIVVFSLATAGTLWFLQGQ